MVFTSALCERPAVDAKRPDAQAAEEKLLQVVDVRHQPDDPGLGFEPRVAHAGVDSCATYGPGTSQARGRHIGVIV